MENKRIVEAQKAQFFSEKLRQKKAIEESMLADGGLKKTELAKQKLIAHKAAQAMEHNS